MTASGCGVGRPHEIADLDVGRADPARERRADQGVALLDLEIVERGLIGLDGRRQDVGLGLGVVDIDLRGRALADEVGVAAQIALRALELRPVPGERALGLFDLGVDLARVEREQEVALVDLGAVLEMNRDDGGFQPRLQRDARDRRHRSDRVDIDRHRLAFGLGDFNRDRARPLRPLRAGVAAHPGRSGYKGAYGNNAKGACKQNPVSFFHSFSRPPVRKGRGRYCSCPLTATFTPYF